MSKITDSLNVPVCTPLAAAVTGALVAGAVAGLEQKKKYEAGKVSKDEAIHAVGQEAAGVGIAAATGVLVGRTLFGFHPLGLAAMLAIGAGTKYLYDEVMYKKVAKASAKSTVNIKTKASPKTTSKPAQKNVKASTKKAKAVSTTGADKKAGNE